MVANHPADTPPALQESLARGTMSGPQAGARAYVLKTLAFAKRVKQDTLIPLSSEAVAFAKRRVKAGRAGAKGISPHYTRGTYTEYTEIAEQYFERRCHAK